MAAGVNSSVANRCADERLDERVEDYSQEQLPNGPHRGGYDCEFVKPPPVEFPQTDCPVCLLILREPHQVACCGNTYCESCVKRVQHDKKCCPTCNEADFTVFPDKRLKRSLYALNVYCCQRGAGCGWAGELGELDRHLNLQPAPEKLLVGCQFSEVNCTYCTQLFQRRCIQAHQTDDCLKRPYSCQHCNQHVSNFEEVTQNHWPVCPYFPLSCPNNCELVLQRQELEHHVIRECPLTVVQCDFHVVGCKVQLIRKNLPSHISENLTGHMSLLQEHMITHPGENMATCLLLMVGSIQKVTTYNASELREARQKLQETCDELQITRSELQESREKIAQLEALQRRKQGENEAKLMAVKYDLTHRITASEQKIQTQEAMLNQHQKTLENVTCTGTLPFEFTMADVEQHRRMNEVWYSPPFYTHTQGYRMCIRVNVSGDGGGRGTHLSVAPRLMRGDFDDDLQWPFEGAITIQLLNQLGDANHHTGTRDYAVVKDPEQTGRVISGEKAPFGSCIDTFIPLTQLGFNAAKNCQYLHDNQLKFRVSEATNLNPTAHVYKRCLALESIARAIEPKVCVIPIEFTLSDFTRQKKHNSVWYSPPFYTHRQGYRMCLQVYPNGCGDGLGTHVSIFTCIMRSPFDAGLKWPFRGNVTVQIVNQAGGNNCQEVIDYTGEVPDECAGRMNDDERADSLGYHQFAVMNTEYLHGDTLLIRISKVVLKKK